MNELTRKALTERVGNIIIDFEQRELSEVDLEDLNYEQLKCIFECLQFGQFKSLKSLSRLELMRLESEKN